MKRPKTFFSSVVVIHFLIFFLHHTFFSKPPTVPSREIPLDLLNLTAFLKQATTAPAATQPVTACCFTLDGSSIVVARHNAVSVVSAANGRAERELPVAIPRTCDMAFNGDGTLLAIAGGVPGSSGKVVIWNWKARAAVGEITGFSDLVTSVAFSADGAIAAASADRSGAVYSLGDAGKRPQRTAELIGHAGPVLDVRFSPDGKTVVTASADRSIKVWEAGGKLLRTLTHHTDIVHCLAIRPTGAGAADAPPWSCASGSDDKTVRIWQPGIGRMVRIVRKHEGAIFALAYTPSGAILFSAGADGVIRAIDADSDQIRFEFKASDDWIYALAVSPDGTSLASGDWAGNIKLWKLDDAGAKPAW